MLKIKLIKLPYHHGFVSVSLMFYKIKIIKKYVILFICNTCMSASFKKIYFEKINNKKFTTIKPIF